MSHAVVTDNSLYAESFNFSAVNIYKDYIQEYGSTQIQSILTSAVMAWGSDSSQPNQNTVLTLGSTGNIQFIVDGEDEAAKMSMNAYDKLEFSGKYGTHIKGGDSNNSVEISATTFTYDAFTRTNHIDAGDHEEMGGDITKKNFEFDAKLSEYTGSVQVHGDMLTNGHMISRSLNVARIGDDGSNVSTGFGFRVTDRDALELYKYDATNSYTQRIAIFGTGHVSVDDACSNFPIFGASNYAPNDQLVLGGGQGGGSSVWEHSGANIFFDAGTGSVLIGSNNQTGGYMLEVHESALFKEGIDFGENGDKLKITTTKIENVEQIKFLNGSSSDIVFNGKITTLEMDTFPTTDPSNRAFWWNYYQENISMRNFNLGSKDGSGTDITDQLTLGHLFHGETYKNLVNSDVEAVFELSITGGYPISGGGYGDIYFGSKTVWFDQCQKEVKLTNFAQDLTHISDLTIENELSVSTIHFDATGSNPEFDGTITTLMGINQFVLSEFIDDIDWKSNLRVEVLEIGEVKDNIKPQSSNNTVGVLNYPFDKGYFNTIHLGDATLDYDTTNSVIRIDKPLQIAQGGIIFDDGSPFNSVGIEGGDLTSFTSFTISSHADKVYRIKGDITLKRERPTSTQSTELNKLYVYELDTTNGIIVPHEEDGTYYQSALNSEHKFELKNGSIIHEQNSTNIDINLTDESGLERKKLYVSTCQPTSINDIIDLNIYIPGTEEFNHKFFVDFNHFYNDAMLTSTRKNPTNLLPFGCISGESMVYNKTRYLTSGNNADTNKMLVQYISYHDVPLVEYYSDVSPSQTSMSNNSNITENDKFCYFASDKNSDADYVNRLDGHYYYVNPDAVAANRVVRIYDDFLLYPKISFRNWKNDRNDTSFEVVPFSEWGVCNSTGIIDPAAIGKDIDESKLWQIQLLELTFSYIKYGRVGLLTADDKIKINDTQTLNILGNPNSYSVVTRDFNGVDIYIGVRLNGVGIFEEFSGDIIIKRPPSP